MTLNLNGNVPVNRMLPNWFVCMCLGTCVYAFACVCMYEYMRVCACVNMNACIYVHACVRASACLKVCKLCTCSLMLHKYFCVDLDG